MLLIYQSCAKSQGIFFIFLSVHFVFVLTSVIQEVSQRSLFVGILVFTPSQIIIAFLVSFELRQVPVSFVSESVELFAVHFLVHFVLHVYKIPHFAQKARDFFAILQIIFVDNYPPIFEKNSYERLNDWSLGPIFKTLQLLNPSFFYL